MSAPIRMVVIVLALSGAPAIAACGGDGSSGPSTEGNEELLTSDGFAKAVDAIKERSGEDAMILRVQITQGGAQFQVATAEGVTGLIYTGGELQDVQVVGTSSSEGDGFPISDIDPGAIDTIKDGVREASGDDQAELSALTLEKSALGGEVRWTVDAQGEHGEHLGFTAAPDGTITAGDSASGSL